MEIMANIATAVINGKAAAERLIMRHSPPRSSEHHQRRFDFVMQVMVKRFKKNDIYVLKFYCARAMTTGLNIVKPMISA